MDVEGDLVERDLRQAQDLGIVVGATAPLELLDDLALARGLGQGGAAALDLDVTAGQVGRGVDPAALGALEPGLGGEEVGAGGAGGQDGVAAGVARGG